MLALNEIQFTAILILHIISVVSGIGAVTVTDYLHLTGLRNKRLESKLLQIYPLLGKMITLSLSFAIITGFILLVARPSLISSPLFILKMSLFAVIVLNGISLHKIVSPAMTKCITKRNKKYCTNNLFIISALSGSISLVTWYAVLVLAMTKNLGYSVPAFLTVYLPLILISFLIALYFEKTNSQ